MVLYYLSSGVKLAKRTPEHTHYSMCKQKEVSRLQIPTATLEASQLGRHHDSVPANAWRNAISATSVSSKSQEL